MFIPKTFRQTDNTALFDAISDYPLATLVIHNQDGLNATHIPLYLVTDENSGMRLQGHIAKANPLWENNPDETNVLVIFQGPDSYISPNYYPSKKEHQKVVPTWNYVAVHIKGKIRFVHDNDWKLTMLNTLTDTHEKNQQLPWSVADAPDDYIERMCNAIVGIEISIESINGKWKVSQNKTQQDKDGVVKGLSENDDQMMAALVKNTEK